MHPEISNDMPNTRGVTDFFLEKPNDISIKDFDLRARSKDYCMLRFSFSLYGVFSKYLTLHRCDLSAQAQGTSYLESIITKHS